MSAMLLLRASLYPAPPAPCLKRLIRSTAEIDLVLITDPVAVVAHPAVGPEAADSVAAVAAVDSPAAVAVGEADSVPLLRLPTVMISLFSLGL
jgi:hypothetical protein